MAESKLSSVSAGVGLKLGNFEGKLVIRQIFANGSAATCKEIQVGDEVVAVDGFLVQNKPIDFVRSLIVGNAGSYVALDLIRATDGKPITVNLKREAESPAMISSSAPSSASSSSSASNYAFNSQPSYAGPIPGQYTPVRISSAYSEIKISTPKTPSFVPSSSSSSSLSSYSIAATSTPFGASSPILMLSGFGNINGNAHLLSKPGSRIMSPCVKPHSLPSSLSDKKSDETSTLKKRVQELETELQRSKEIEISVTEALERKLREEMTAFAELQLGKETEIAELRAQIVALQRRLEQAEETKLREMREKNIALIKRIKEQGDEEERSPRIEPQPTTTAVDIVSRSPALKPEDLAVSADDHALNATENQLHDLKKRILELESQFHPPSNDAAKNNNNNNNNNTYRNSLNEYNNNNNSTSSIINNAIFARNIQPVVKILSTRDLSATDRVEEVAPTALQDAWKINSRSVTGGTFLSYPSSS